MPVEPSLKARVLRAGGWSVLAHVLGNVLRLGSSLVMTRLLVPEMFGVMAIATVVLVVVSLLSDVGLRQSIIQSPRGNDPAFLNTAWTLQLIRGMLIWSVCLCMAGGLYLGDQMSWLPVGSVYAAASLPGVLAASSFSAVITGLQSTKLMTASRSLNLKRVSMMELIAQLSSIVVMFALGWWTRSIWSFVAGGLVASLVSTTLGHLWLPGIRNRIEWSPAAAKEILDYGRWIFLSTMFYVIAINADRLLIGAWVSAALLGYYVIALNLVLVMEGLGQRLVSSTAMPALSEAARSHPQRFREIYFRMRLPLDLAYLGMAGFLYAAGPFIIKLLYDDRYAPAGQMLQLLSFVLLFSRYDLAQNAYLALGHPRYQSVTNGVKLISVLVLLPVLYLTYGLPGAICAVAFHAAATLPVIYAFNRRHGLNDLRFEMLVLLAWPAGYLLATLARLV